jgi:hypothetical protein
LVERIAKAIEASPVAIALSPRPALPRIIPTDARVAETTADQTMFSLFTIPPVFLVDRNKSSLTLNFQNYLGAGNSFTKGRASQYRTAIVARLVLDNDLVW